ncbi:MAG TPA: nucleotide exchange factor GrpE [Candidatus Limnocylindria bacterium]|nr:nucleotide exchange factor GrpE [Candidatus Limnocylindria bacterium]
MKDKEKGSAQEEGELLTEREEPSDRQEFTEQEEDELARVKSQLAYLAAEFDNYRKRIAREQEAIVSFGNERILLAILPFLDNLERAISQSQATENAEVLLSGVQMTYEQVLGELRKFGLEQISAVGELFDPNLYEAIAKVAWEGKPEGTVLAESRKGYLLNGRLLRPAQVTVAQEAAETESGGGTGQESADGEA